MPTHKEVQVITCPKCHGNKFYYEFVSYDDKYDCAFEKRECLICGQTGKINLVDYEKYQSKFRDKE